MARRGPSVTAIVMSLVMAVMLWGYVSLTRTYEDYVDVPFTVEAPPDQALLSAVPQRLSIRARGSGWRLFNLRLFPSSARCTVALERLRPDGSLVYTVSKSDVMRAIQLPQAVQALDVDPHTITIAVGDRATRIVPVTMRYRVEPRPGFVVGAPRIDPPTVSLRGSVRTVEGISSWPTQRLVVLDAMADINTTINVSDSLSSVMSASPTSVNVHIPIQQYADLAISDVVVPQPATSGARMISVEPSRITVILQGGVDDLAAIRPEQISVTLPPTLPTATSGYVRPVVTAPAGVRVAATQPAMLYVANRAVRTRN